MSTLMSPGRMADTSRLAAGLISRALGGSLAVPSAAPSLRVGVDVVEVADVVRSVDRFGDRYVRRIFTSHEIDSCRTAGSHRSTAAAGGPAGPSYSFESLAARFAAKEATVKVLRPEGPRPEWRTIEVHRADSGWCELRLTGLAALLAERAGIDQLAVSLTHEATLGVAVVVATCTGDPDPEVHRGTGEAVHSPPITTREER